MYTDKFTKKIKRILFPVCDISTGAFSLYFKALPEDAKIWKFDLLQGDTGHASIYVSHHTFPDTEYCIIDILGGKHLPCNRFMYDSVAKRYYVE